MALPRQALTQQEGTCGAHAQFEARIDERFDALAAAVEKVANTTEAIQTDIRGVVERLGDGRVEFALLAGRILAVENKTVECVLDREKIKTEVKFLTRGYWMAVGAMLLLQVLLKLFLT